MTGSHPLIAEGRAYLESGDPPQVPTKLVRDLTDAVERMSRSLTVIVCAWCGAETPREAHEALVGHMTTCEKRLDASELQLRAYEASLRAADQENRDLRALVARGSELLGEAKRELEALRNRWSK